MSKAGEKLLAAAREVLEAFKCDHDWRHDVMHIENGKLICVTVRCDKCRMRQTTFSR